MAHEIESNDSMVSAEPDQRIEPERGETYATGKVAVYEYSTYPRHSVLANQTRRSWLDSFDTVEEAATAFPNAKVCGGSCYQPVSLAHLPDADGPDPYGDNEDAGGDE